MFRNKKKTCVSHFMTKKVIQTFKKKSEIKLFTDKPQLSNIEKKRLDAKISKNKNKKVFQKIAYV